ncbi:hypothetical protein ACLBWT_05940 [Paenibacillus sp. D51F]
MDQKQGLDLPAVNDAARTSRSDRKSRQARLIAASALLLMLSMSSAMSVPSRAHASAAALEKTQSDRIDASRIGWTAAAAQAAGLPVDQLVERLRNGETPAEAASLSSSAEDAVIRGVYRPWEAELERQLSSGELTEAQAEAQKSALLTAARGLVTGEWS